MKHLLIILSFALLTVTNGFAQNGTEAKEEKQVEQKQENTATQKKKSVRYIEETEIFLMPEAGVAIA